MNLWYASYGSNLARDRFETYLSGGRPQGAERTYVGARDSTPPQGDRPFTMPGALFFGWSSPTWDGGGVAFYDPSGKGTVLARAYLLTESQFADVAAQEMHRATGEEDLDLSTVLRERVHQAGSGRYETLHLLGELDGSPVLTFTAPAGHGMAAKAPSEAYRATIVRGLLDSHGLTIEQAEGYVDSW